jgi:hypothetical protein
VSVRQYRLKQSQLWETFSVRGLQQTSNLKFYEFWLKWANMSSNRHTHTHARTRTHTHHTRIQARTFLLEHRLCKSSLNCATTRPVHLRRKVGFWAVTTVPTVITPYSMVQITVGQSYGVRPYKTVPPHSTIMTVIWPFGSKFDPKQNISFCNQNL